jgi:hypothetical protein
MSLARTAAGYDKEARSGIFTHKVNDDIRGNGGNQTAAFARRGLDAEDPRDEIMRAKMELIKEGKSTGMTPFGLVTVTEEDLSWLRKKRDVEQKYALDAWIGTNFHTNDVTTRAWLQEIYPDYMDSREQVLVDRAKFALRVNLLLLRGPKNHKDLVLYWALQQGLVTLDRDWDRIGPGAEKVDMAEEKTRFKSGLMNPWTYKSDKERSKNAKQSNNPFRPNGTEASQNSAAQAGLGAFSGFGLNVPNQSRYPNFLNKILGSALYGGEPAIQAAAIPGAQ